MITFFFLISAQLRTNEKRFGFFDELECRNEKDALELVEEILRGRAEKEFGHRKGEFTYNFCIRSKYVDGVKVE